MKRLLDLILKILSERFNAFAEDCAEAVESGDRFQLLVSIFRAFLAVIVILAAVAVFYFGRRIFIPLIGSVLLVTVLIASYQANHVDQGQTKRVVRDKVLLEARAEAVYSCLKDAIYLVLREASSYCNIIRPTTPSLIETQERYYIKEASYPIFLFTVQIVGEVDTYRVKRELNEILGKMIRAHEIRGISGDLVCVRGIYYPPICVIDVTELGTSLQISVVFVNERTVSAIEVAEVLQRAGSLKQMHIEMPHDDEF